MDGALPHGSCRNIHPCLLAWKVAWVLREGWGGRPASCSPTLIQCRMSGTPSHCTLRLNAQKCISLGSTFGPVPGGSDGKVSPCNTGDPGLIPGLGRSPGEGNGNPLQYSCLGNPMDRGAWQSWGCKESETTEQLTHTLQMCVLQMRNSRLRELK